MERRDFLKKSALAVSVVTLAGLSESGLNNIYAETKNKYKSFSFEIITDKPEAALKLSEEFFKGNSI